MHEECRHRGFVVRDIQASKRFLCRECGARFIRHPWLPPSVIVTSVDPLKIVATMEGFREGMLTFTQAVQRTQFSIEEFNDSLKKLFPPEKVTETLVHQSLRGAPQEVVISETYEPQRTSCPQEVDAIFGDPNVNFDDITKIMETAFKDIVQIETQEDPNTGKMIYILGFIDGTRQKVILNEQDLPKLGRLGVKNPWE